MRRLVMDGLVPARVPDCVIAEIRSRERRGLIELPKLRRNEYRVVNAGHIPAVGDHLLEVGIVGESEVHRLQIFRLADAEKVRIAALHRLTLGADRLGIARMPALLVLAGHANDLRVKHRHDGVVGRRLAALAAVRVLAATAIPSPLPGVAHVQ